MRHSRNSSSGTVHAPVCQLAGEVLLSSGGLRLPARGWSMLPSVWPGDTMEIESATSDALSEGDIAVFGRDGRLFAHRVVAKTNAVLGSAAQIVTHGDALRYPDAPVSDKELLGRVTSIVRNGKRFVPPRSLRFFGRAAGLICRSEFLVRALLRIHGMRQSFQVRNARAVPCQN